MTEHNFFSKLRFFIGNSVTILPYEHRPRMTFFFFSWEHPPPPWWTGGECPVVIGDVGTCMSGTVCLKRNHYYFSMNSSAAFSTFRQFGNQRRCLL